MHGLNICKSSHVKKQQGKGPNESKKNIFRELIREKYKCKILNVKYKCMKIALDDNNKTVK